MNAVILAGGFGNRLKPITNEIPKPMLTLLDAPIIDYDINQLAYFGIKDISFSLAFLPEQIIEWVLGYKDIKSHFNVEETPLGTCGGVKAIEKHLDNNFFVLSGDGISNIDLSAMSALHHRLDADVTIAVTEMRDPSLYGVIRCDKSGYVSEFEEKPKRKIADGYINCGVYIINKKVLKLVPEGFFDFSKDLFPILLARGMKIAAYLHKGYWNDIGSFGGYYETSFFVKENGCFYQKLKNVNRGIYEGYRAGTEPQSFVNNSASVVGNIHNCIVGNGATIISGSVLENCIILENANVSNRHSNCIISKDYVVDITEYSLINKDSSNYLAENFK